MPKKVNNIPSGNEKVFDDVLKTFQQKMPEHMIPLINEAMGTDYPADTKIDEPRNEYSTGRGNRLADSVVRIKGKKYHGEIQANFDSKMSVRMMEYDVAIALDDMIKKPDGHVFEFPESFIVYIRHLGSTENAITYEIKSGNNIISRTVPVVRMMDYTLEKIKLNNLLIFLPYYIVNYEKALRFDYKKAKRVTEKTLEDIRNDYAIIEMMLSGDPDNPGEVTRGRIYSLIRNVAEHVLSNAGLDEKSKSEVREAMGGQVLELDVDIAEARGERRGEKRGKKCGEIYKAERVFRNMINRGYSVEEAIAVSEITEEQARNLLEKMGISKISNENN